MTMHRLLPLVLLGLAYFGFQILKDMRPDKEGTSSPEIPAHAEFIEVSPSEYTPGVESFGTVQAHFQTTLTPQISGLIVTVSKDFRVGKIIPKGTTLIWIDERSYKSLLIQQEANLAEAKLAYAEEQIQAQQAIEDWIASGRDLKKASDFVLRKPQIIAAEAMIEFSAMSKMCRDRSSISAVMILLPPSKFNALAISSKDASSTMKQVEFLPISSR